MARTFIASDPRSGKHEALIEVPPELLLPEDTFKSVDFFSESSEVKCLPTHMLFSRIDEHGEGLYVQLRRWLEAVGCSF